MIPEFLKRENVIQNENELTSTLRAYKAQFNECISLDWLSISEEEWVKVLKECMRQNKSFQEVFGKIEYEEDTDY